MNQPLLLSPAAVIGPWNTCPDLDARHRQNIITRLVPAANRLIDVMTHDKVFPVINRHTGTIISGETLGGFRPQACTIGAPQSNHKAGLAVDIFDPHGEIDAWCLANTDRLQAAGIYLEHPDATEGWSHWQCVPPASGRRVFRP